MSTAGRHAGHPPRRSPQAIRCRRKARAMPRARCGPACLGARACVLLLQPAANALTNDSDRSPRRIVERCEPVNVLAPFQGEGDHRRGSEPPASTNWSATIFMLHLSLRAVAGRRCSRCTAVALSASSRHAESPAAPSRQLLGQRGGESGDNSSQPLLSLLSLFLASTRLVTAVGCGFTVRRESSHWDKQQLTQINGARNSPSVSGTALAASL